MQNSNNNKDMNQLAGGNMTIFFKKKKSPLEVKKLKFGGGGEMFP